MSIFDNPQTLELIVPVVTFLFVSMIIGVFLRKQVQGQRNILQALSMSRSARVEEGGSSWPRLIINLAGGEATVCLVPGSANSQSQTTFSFKSQIPCSVKIDVFPCSFLETRFGLWNMKKMDFGDSQFTASFRILASEEMSVMRFLSPEVQRSLLAIKELKPTVIVRGQKLTLTVKSEIKDPVALELFVQGGEALVQEFSRMAC